ncbi:MAG: flavodoxin family protein, partial [Delftia sp.]|nr:flavodoxin family protein [Delftia sp.]
MNASKTLLIVYHSMTGGTRQMAEAARDGAAAEGQGVQVR